MRSLLLPDALTLRSEQLKVRVCETFASLQGESTHAGRKCFFIRLAGCNLDCSYCDTRYARSFEAGTQRSVASLVDEVLSSGLTLAEITGGEPLCSPETPHLCQALIDKGIEVLLETNGSMPIGDVPVQVRKILDCKLPDSGMSGSICYENYALLQKHDEVKFVISSRADFDFACEIIVKYALFERTPHLIASPVWGRVSFEELSSYVMESPLPWRMQLQMHKIIWGDRRGV